MKKLSFIIVIIVAISLTGCIFGAGSYCNDPAYVLEMDEVSTLRALKEMKNKHPEYNLEFTDGGGNKYTLDEYFSPFYYCIVFKMPMNDTTLVVMTLVNIASLLNNNINFESTNAKSDNTETELLLHSYSFDLTDRGWRLHEQWADSKYPNELKVVQKTFEKEVLDKLGVKYRKQWLR